MTAVRIIAAKRQTPAGPARDCTATPDGAQWFGSINAVPMQTIGRTLEGGASGYRGPGNSVTCRHVIDSVDAVQCFGSRQGFDTVAMILFVDVMNVFVTEQVQESGLSQIDQAAGHSDLRGGAQEAGYRDP